MPATIRDRVIEFKRINRDDVLPHSLNWRRHPENQRAALRGLIAEIGIAGAALAYYSERNDGKLTLVDGHLRREEIPEQLPVIITDLNDVEADKLLASYDPVAAMAEADKEQLDKLLREVSTGDAALSQMLSDLAAESGLTYGTQPDPVDAPDADVDHAAELQVKWATELGQLWQIGNHRLLCGDSTNAEDVARVLGGAKPHLMVTDPPYGVEYDPSWSDGGIHGVRENQQLAKVKNDDRFDWGAAWQLFQGGVAYIWHARLGASSIYGDLEANRFQVRAQIIWAKPRPVIARAGYHWQHEACWYAVRKGKTANWIGDRTNSTLWSIGISDAEFDHGTQKPLECMARPIRNHEGDVYDPFVGVGTTIVAAEQLKRTCYAIDVDAKWIGVTLERLSQMGLEPKLIESETHATA